MKKNIIYGIVAIVVFIIVIGYFSFSGSEENSNINDIGEDKIDGDNNDVVGEDKIDGDNNDVVEEEVEEVEKGKGYYNTEDTPLKPSEFIAIEDKDKGMIYYIQNSAGDSGFWDGCEIDVLPCTDISELPQRALYVDAHDLRIFYKANDISEVGGWKKGEYYLFEVKPILEPIILPGTNKPYDINAAEMVSFKHLSGNLGDRPTINP